MIAFLSLASALLLGVLVVEAIAQDGEERSLSLPLTLALGCGVGLGLSSAIYAAVCYVGGGALACAVVEGLAMLAALVLALRSRPRPRPLGSLGLIPLLVTLVLVVVAVHVALVSVDNYVNRYSLEPHGSFDAWAIWGTRARTLYRVGPSWPGIMAVQTFHGDYPLLIPGFSARCWAYLGTEEAGWVQPVCAGLFLFATAAVLAAALAALRSAIQGCLAVILMLGSRDLIVQAASLCADVPLAFYMVASLALLTLALREESPKPRLLALSGLCAALAAWTKNEGILYLVVVSAVVGAPILWRARRAELESGRGAELWSGFRRRALPFALGALPVLLVLVYFKLFLAPSNDIVGGQGLDTTFGRITDWSRYPKIVVAGYEKVAAMVWDIGSRKRSTEWPMVLFVAAYAVLAGHQSKELRGQARVGLAILGLMLAGFFMVYLTTPQKIDWHLKYSADRLLIQLYPSMTFVFFLLVRDPKGVLDGGPGRLSTKAGAEKPAEESLAS